MDRKARKRVLRPLYTAPKTLKKVTRGLNTVKRKSAVNVKRINGAYESQGQRGRAECSVNRFNKAGKVNRWPQTCFLAFPQQLVAEN